MQPIAPRPSGWMSVIAVGVGGRAVAEDLAQDRRAAAPRVLQLFQHQHRAAPSPSTKPSRSRSRRGGKRARGSSLRVERAVSRLKPVTPKGMDHAVRAAGEHHVGVAAADQLGRLADRLAAGGAGGEAVDVGALRPEHARQVARAGTFGSCWNSSPAGSNIVHADAGTSAGRCRRLPSSLSREAPHSSGRLNVCEVLVSLAAAEVDAEPQRIVDAVEHLELLVLVHVA